MLLLCLRRRFMHCTGSDSIGRRRWLSFGIDWRFWGPLDLTALLSIKCSFVYVPIALLTIYSAVLSFALGFESVSGVYIFSATSLPFSVPMVFFGGMILMTGWIERCTTTRRSVLPPLSRRKRRILWYDPKPPTHDAPS